MLDFFQNALPAVPWPFLLAIFLAVSFLSPRIRSKANDVISAIINKYLVWKHPIRHKDTGKEIPTCPYRFPNGQGDVGKFLKGLENSEKWRSYGSVYRIWSGTRPEIVLTHPDHIRTVFKDSDKHSKAVDNNSGYLMSQILGRCVGLVSGEEWRGLRAAVEVPFVHKKTAEYVPMIEGHVRRHLAGLDSTGSGLLDPAEDTKLIPFWIVAEVFYGELSAELVDELRELAPLREGLFKHVIAGGVARFAWARHLPTEAMRTLVEFRGRWKTFNDRAHAHAVSTTANKPAPPPPIVVFYDLVRDGTITAEQLLQTLDEALFANLDVTTGGISWNLVFLAARPGYQARLREEISARSASADDRRKYLLGGTSLLAACVNESSRLRPLAAFSVPQSAPTERVIDGYRVPAGTDFIVDSYGLNIRSGFWGEDAGTYRPERFLENGTVERRYHFWRFGFGPRQCMGRYVADVVIRSLVAELVMGWELGLVDEGEDWGRDPEVWINHPRMEIRCVKRGCVDV